MNRIIKINTCNDSKYSEDFQTFETDVDTKAIWIDENYSEWDWDHFNSLVLDCYPGGKVAVVFPKEGNLDFFFRIRDGIEHPGNGTFWKESVKVSTAK